MHEGRLFETDIHERRLHPRQDFGHLSFIDVPNEILVLHPVAEQISDDPSIQHRHTSFFPCNRDRNFNSHTDSFASKTEYSCQVRWTQASAQVSRSPADLSTFDIIHSEQGHVSIALIRTSFNKIDSTAYV